MNAKRTLAANQLITRLVYVFYLHQVPLPIQLDYKRLDTRFSLFTVRKFVYQSQLPACAQLIACGHSNESSDMNCASTHEKISRVKLNSSVWKLVSLKLNSPVDHSTMTLNLKTVLSLRWIATLFPLVLDRKKLNDLSCPLLMVPLIIMNLIVLSVSCLLSPSLINRCHICDDHLFSLFLSLSRDLFSPSFAALDNYSEWRERKG